MLGGSLSADNAYTVRMTMIGDFEGTSNVRSRKHSRTGCITCKVRKKRCSEDKPVCKDCQRLGFTCTYLPKNTDRRVLQRYKEQVEKELFEQKFNRKKPRSVDKAACGPDFEHALEDIGSESGNESGHENEKGNEYEDEKSCENEEHSEDDKDCEPEEGYEEVQRQDYGLRHLTTLAGEHILDLDEEFYLSPHYSQPLTDPICLELDDVGMYLYNYYRNHLAQIISIAPSRQNYYLQVFLPMAHQHKGILYGLMAWSAHHLSITETASDVQCKDKNYLTIANQYTLSSLTRLRSDTSDSNFLWSLAQILILCAAEICQGDVNKWKILLKYGADLINKNCEKDISKILSSNDFNNLDSTTRYWLIANFMYHDIMCSRQTFFPMTQYKKILDNQSTHDLRSLDDSNLQLDPLNGINRPILLLIGDITNLTRKMKQDSPTFNKDHPHFEEHMMAAMDIQSRLYQLAPNIMEMKLYEEFSNDYQLSLELFQLMQTAALVHLKTICLKYPNGSIEIQYLWKILSEKLRLVLGTKLEGSLCFPLFICGINSVDEAQKCLVESMFDDMMKRYKCYNFQRARTIMRKVWKQNNLNESGSNRSSISSSSGEDDIFDIRNRDWYDIVDELGWDISFA